MNIQTFTLLVIFVLLSRAIRTFRLRNKEQNSVAEEITDFIGQLVVTTVIYLIVYYTAIFILG
jgi:cystathionine beta-lyase/cystathionine gamma-synthase